MHIRRGAQDTFLFLVASLHFGDGLLRPLFGLRAKRSMDFDYAFRVLLFLRASVAFCLLDNRLTLFVRARYDSLGLQLGIQQAFQSVIDHA